MFLILCNWSLFTVLKVYVIVHILYMSIFLDFMNIFEAYVIGN